MAILLQIPSLRSRAFQATFAAFVCIALFAVFYTSSDSIRPGPLAFTPRPWASKPHPIDTLIREADAQFNTLLAKETQSLHDAAEVYRQRRGRQPPPGFDKWHEFARNRSAVMVEDFWDRIYHDLGPFWGVPPQTMREQANDFLHRISVRNGRASYRSDGRERPWMILWTDLVGTVAEWLPDVDLPINVMDETRLFVPWEEINNNMRAEAESRRVVPAEQLKDTFHGLRDLDAQAPPAFNPHWNMARRVWTVAAAGCPPDSPARDTAAETDFSAPPPLPRTYPAHSYEGYVSNITLARSPCDNPELRGLHGSFIEPISRSTSTELFPMFGGCKLPMNNEILLPPAMYWTDDPFYSGGQQHGEPWELKHPGTIWRGSASGGRNRIDNWMRFQRHRFVSMVNGTSVARAELEPDQPPPNFVLPEKSYYGLAAHSPKSQPGDLGRWVDTWGDASMTHLLCFPGNKGGEPRYCPYTDPYFRAQKGIPMQEQYDYKYLPDIDGNSFSGRYRGFLGSTSTPIKATIYEEWHDSRLVPWVHYVPMDNTFIDIYGLLQYFVGNAEAGVPGHDDAGLAIAMSGKAWTERVLRREDMQIYVFRLLLEYARLCDDDRLVLGWKESAP